MQKYPAIAFKIMEELSRRLEKAENLIKDISLHSVEQRLAQSLLALSREQPKVTLKMTKGDFASHIGMSQETLSRKLAAFQEQGLIKLVGQRQIIILDRQGLEAIIEQQP
jgi:CRP/FNR family transcriptional regulator